MRWHEALHPVVMQRVALLAPREELRNLLVNVADEGTVSLDLPSTDADGSAGPPPAVARLQHLSAAGVVRPTLAPAPPDLDRCEQDGRIDLVAGEAQLELRSVAAAAQGSVCALTGWTPSVALPHLADRLAGLGGVVVPLTRPPGVTPPTLLPDSGANRQFAPLVETYATVPYADVNPAVLAGLAYLLMFGMMFADVGHGALLVVVAIVIRLGRSRRLARLRRYWVFLAGAGLASMVFGSLYGEFFGPTDVIPVVWLAPLDHPVTLLVAAVAVGGLLLAGAYALGSVNRFREGGWRATLYAQSGLGGGVLFLGLAVAAAAVYGDLGWLVLCGVAVTILGLVGVYVGLLVSAGGGAAGAAEAAVELFNLVVRLGSNLVSFARLAAFGLTHAALCWVVWSATTSLWGHGPAGAAGAAVLFLVGNAVAFALEGLVAGIQALRLEYFELFSRVFDGEGVPFRPWHVPLSTTEVSCRPG